MGTHRWEVKANTRGEIFEGQNVGNNSALSLEIVAPDLPELVLNMTTWSTCTTR